MTEYIQVVTTTEKKEEAQRIARTMLEKRLAGCVQIIGPVSSVYWWKDEIEVAEEWICVIKSRIDLYREMEESIREIHSYEVPEILAVPIAAGSESYLKWLRKQTKVEPATVR